jgi:uncharacterized protein
VHTGELFPAAGLQGHHIAGHDEEAGNKTKGCQRMPQLEQTKGGGENPKGPAAESEEQPQGLSTAGHMANQIQQDLEDGVGDDPVSFLMQHGDEEASDGDDREGGMPHDSVQAQGPQSAQVTGDQGNTNNANIEQLFEAVAKGRVGKVDKLLSRGKVSPDWRDGEGRTPLIIGADVGNASLVGVLIRHNADVNAVDADGETGLMKAAFGGHLKVAELLVENGADLGMRNNDGSTALEIAQVMKRDAVVAFLAAQFQGPTSSTETETSTDPDDDDPITDGPAGASLPVPPAMTPSPDPYSEAVEATGKASTKILDTHGSVLEKKTETIPTLQTSAPSTNEKRIEFDALDNKQVRSINQKIIKIFDKAGREVGDYVVDTVFKGSHLAVLKRRSQENKRWGKLKRHPEWVIDPRKLTEITGACAARRYCLAEGIDISPFSLSHFIELYYVKDLKLLLTVAEDASTNNYTVRQLKQAVEDLREHKDDHDPGKVIIKTLDQPVPLLDDPDLAELCKDKDRVLEELSRAERKKIRSLIKARKPGLDEWKNLMDTFEAILSDLEDE